MKQELKDEMEILLDKDDDKVEKVYKLLADVCDGQIDYALNILNKTKARIISERGDVR